MQLGNMCTESLKMNLLTAVGAEIFWRKLVCLGYNTVRDKTVQMYCDVGVFLE